MKSLRILQFLLYGLCPIGALAVGLQWYFSSYMPKKKDMSSGHIYAFHGNHNITTYLTYSENRLNDILLGLAFVYVIGTGVFMLFTLKHKNEAKKNGA